MKNDHPERNFSSVHFPFRITFIKPTKPSPAAMICACSSGDRFTPAAVAIKISPLQVEFCESESTIVDSIFMVFLISAFYTTIPRQCKFRERERECEAMPRPPRTRSTQPLRVRTSRRTYEKHGCPLAQTALGDEFFGKCAWLKNYRAPLACGR